MWQGVLCGLVAGAMWGMVFIVPELLHAFSPVEIMVGRYVAYGAIAFGLMAPRLPELLHRLERSDYGYLLRHALAGNIVYYVLLALGVKLAGVAPTSLIIGVLPIAVTRMGHKDHDWTAFWITNSLLALGASVIGNHLWNIASRKVPVTLSGQLILFETLFALLYGFIYAQRMPRVLEIAAIVLLSAGVAWSVRVHALEEPVAPA